MKRLRRFIQRLRAAFTPATPGEDILQAEIEDHISRLTADNLRAGMAPAEARRQARLKFGNVETVKEDYRDQRGLPFLETLFRDARHALRRLRATPVFTGAVVLTLALGLGANTAIFGVIDCILLRPLPYPDAARLVGVWHTAPGLPSFGGVANCSPSMYFTYRAANRSFEQFGLWSVGGARVTVAGEPELLRALFVTHGVLNALNIQPALGRWFTPADDTPGSSDTVILTYGYWQRRFNGDASVLGQPITINSKPRTVIGVMPAVFRFQRDSDLILPHRFERNKVVLGEFSYNGIARLKPGVTIAQADSDLARMLPIWLDSWPPPPGFDAAVFREARFGPGIQPLKQEIVGNVASSLWLVMGTLALLLLIACANVANLFLVRAESRRHELALRAALGAGRARIAMEMLVECATLGLLGGALGLGLAHVALRILVAHGPDTLPRLHEVRIDPMVALFAVCSSLLSAALFGLVPAWKYAAIRAGTPLGGLGRTVGETREHNRVRNVLVSLQVALALVLLVASGLMIRTFQHLRGVQPGFSRPDELQIVHTSAPDAILKEPVRTMRMWDEIRDSLAAIPGVTSVGFASVAPMGSMLGFRNVNPLYAEDKALPAGQVPAVRTFRLIAPKYFKTTGTRFVAGRDFTPSDLYQMRHVAILSENLAREWWQDPRAALGKRVRETSIAPWREVVGVVEDIYDNGAQAKAPEFVYLPALMDRYLVFDREFVLGQGAFLIRSRQAGTEALLSQVRQAVWARNGRQPLSGVTTLENLCARSMAQTSFTLVVLSIAGGMAMLLGIVGIYGVVAYMLSQRTREIGVRIAIGAPRGRLLARFVHQAVWLALAGIALGLPFAALFTRFMSSMLFGVTALDPLTYGTVAMLLLAVSAAASYFPVRRALSVDPVRALRGD